MHLEVAAFLNRLFLTDVFDLEHGRTATLTVTD